MIYRVAIMDLASARDQAAVVEGTAWLGRKVETRFGDIEVCGVQIARARAGVARPLSASADLLLVDERGELPKTRLHPPQLTKFGRAYLRALAAGSPPPAGASRTVGALRRMGMLSVEGPHITELAWRLFGSQITPK